MPAIRMFGRRWNVATDDFVFPGVIEIVTRTAWMIALLIVYILEVDELGRCQNGTKLQAFYIGIILLLMVYFIINISMVTVSARGYIMDPTSRRHVSTLLYIKLALFLPEISWAVVGTLWTFQLEHDCRKLPVGLGKAIVVVEWVIIALVLISLYLMFDPLGRRHVKKRSLKDYNKMWHDRCRVLCCCILQDENRREAFEEITELLSNFFRGRDYVLSDVFAGVVLLNIKQRYQERQEKKVTLSEAPTLPIRSPRTRDSAPGAIPLARQLGRVDIEMSHTGRYVGQLNQGFVPDMTGASATEMKMDFPEEDTQLFKSSSVKSYGSSGASSLDTFEKFYPNGYADTKPQLPSNVPLRKHLPKCPSVASSSSSTYSDSVFYPMAPPIGPKRWMTLENCAYYLRIATAIYGSSNYSGCYNCSDRIPLCKKYRWRSSDEHLPSTVVQGDNWWECEISSIMLYAGFSRDQIIYANLDNQIFQTPYFIARDDAKKAVVIAIRGTMSAGDALTDLTAQGVDIREENIPRGNVHSGVLKVARRMVQQLREHVRLQDKVPRGYSLVVTGHSLGAGVAAILALLLRGEYPDLTCFAFSPPGGLVSQMLSVFMQEFTLSLFLGMDVVPRLSVITMEKLKSDLMVVIKNSRIPKYKILSSGMRAMCCGWSDSRLNDLLIEDTLTQRLTESIYQEIYRDAHDTQSLSGSSLGDTDSIYEHFAARGKSYRESFSSSVTDTESEVTDYEWPYEGHDKVSRTSSSASSSSRTSRTSVTSTRGRPLSASHAKWRSKQKKVKKGLAASEPLLLPGLIMYLYQDDDLSTTGCCSSSEVYRYRWARAEEFDHVILDSRMMNHHNPYSIRDALEQILEQEGFNGFAYGEQIVDTEPRSGAGNIFAKPFFSETDTDSAAENPEARRIDRQELTNHKPDEMYVVNIPTDVTPEEPKDSETGKFNYNLVAEISETMPTLQLEHLNSDDVKPTELSVQKESNLDSNDTSQSDLQDTLEINVGCSTTQDEATNLLTAAEYHEEMTSDMPAEEIVDDAEIDDASTVRSSDIEDITSDSCDVSDDDDDCDEMVSCQRTYDCDPAYNSESDEVSEPTGLVVHTEYGNDKVPTGREESFTDHRAVEEYILTISDDTHEGYRHSPGLDAEESSSYEALPRVEHDERSHSVRSTSVTTWQDDPDRDCHDDEDSECVDHHPKPALHMTDATSLDNTDCDDDNPADNDRESDDDDSDGFTPGITV